MLLSVVTLLEKANDQPQQILIRASKFQIPEAVKILIVIFFVTDKI